MRVFFDFRFYGYTLTVGQEKIGLTKETSKFPE